MIETTGALGIARRFDIGQAPPAGQAVVALQQQQQQQRNNHSHGRAPSAELGNVAKGDLGERAQKWLVCQAKRCCGGSGGGPGTDPFFGRAAGLFRVDPRGVLHAGHQLASPPAFRVLPQGRGARSRAPHHLQARATSEQAKATLAGGGGGRGRGRKRPVNF